MIADRANEREGHTCFPGIARLAHDTGFSERTVQNAIKWGTENGEISILSRGGYRGGRGLANTYRVEFKTQEVREAKTQEVREAQTLHEPPSGLHETAAPGFTQESAPLRATGAPQPEAEPKGINQKKEETSVNQPLSDSLPEADDSAFGFWKTFFTNKTGNDLVDVDEVSAVFKSRLAEGYRGHHLTAAIAGALEEIAAEDRGTLSARWILDRENLDRLVLLADPRCRSLPTSGEGSDQ